MPVQIFNRLSDKKNYMFLYWVCTAEKEYKVMKLSVIEQY